MSELHKTQKERDHYKKQYEDAEIVIVALKKEIGKGWNEVEKLKAEIKELNSEIEDLETTIRTLKRL
jgi:peptidoglycan hydrolase CwlO-like protein